MTWTMTITGDDFTVDHSRAPWPIPGCTMIRFLEKPNRAELTFEDLAAENAALREQIVTAWDEGEASGRSRARLRPAPNPYRAALALPEGEPNG
jgi:hypothetical protein